jgi:hypothetical protein
MNTYGRTGRRWNVNEVLSLQREYELLELSIEEIASRHERSEKAIIFKLISEGWVDSTFYFNMEQNNTVVDDNDNVNQVSDSDNLQALDMRVYQLECAVEDISHILEELVKQQSSSKKTNKSFI